MKKKLLFIASLLSVVLIFGLCSCGGDESTEQAKEEPLNLTGEWVQTNSNSEDMWHEATIEGDVIEIYWVSNNGDTRDLYWAGTYVAPTDAGDSYAWTSENDTSKTDAALLASTSETKEFKFENNELVYEASSMGTDMTIRMERK